MKLIYVFVFTYAKIHFSHVAVHIVLNVRDGIASEYPSIVFLSIVKLGFTGV